MAAARCHRKKEEMNDFGSALSIVAVSAHAGISPRTRALVRPHHSEKRQVEPFNSPDQTLHNFFFDTDPPRVVSSPSMRDRPTLKSLFRELHRQTAGAAMVEYIVLIGVVALSSSVALVGLGVAVYRNFAVVRNLLLAPYP